MSVINVPEPTKEPRQRSINQEDIYLTRYIYPWTRPVQASPEAWRWWVFNEPIAMICRETLIANVINLDWEITPRKSELRDELRAVTRHYTDLLSAGGDYYHGMDWTGLIEWLLADLQDLPFGAGAEIGRKNDSPDGRVMWIRPLDAGTLYPTLNRDYPVVQYYQTYDIVTFPRHAIARMYMSPRPELLREGWGLAPPEKIYFALLMLYHGDKYYADLLLDSPPAGILDLGDMDKDAALEWAESYRNFLIGKSSAFKIPVLYEHNTKTEFISFGKVPNDIMFDKITLKYAAIVAAAYGMTLSDVGLQTTTSSGQTLAGSIRDERKTKRTGYARAKKKVKYFIESILPPTLQFNFIDLDDELNVALGRARLANATAQKIWIESKQFSPKEMRLQNMSDGIITVNLPEEPPDDSEFPEMGNSQDRPGLLGYPEAASSGGQGEVKSTVVRVERTKNFDSHLKRFVSDLTKNVGQIISESKQGLSDDDMYLLRSTIDESMFGEEDVLHILEVIKAQWDGKKWFRLETDGFADELKKYAIESAGNVLRTRFESGDEFDLEVKLSEAIEKLHSVNWDKVAQEFTDILNDSAKIFLGKSTVFVLKDLILSDEYMFDTETSGEYDLVDKVYQSISDNLDEFVSASVGIETEVLLNKIIEEMI